MRWRRSPRTGRHSPRVPPHASIVTDHGSRTTTQNTLNLLTLSSCPRPAFCIPRGMSEKDELNALTETIIGAAIAVHHALGPGMLESAYDAYLALELLMLGLPIER